MTDKPIRFDKSDIENGITKITLTGKLDIHGAFAVEDEFAAVAKARNKVVVDLTNVTFMASLGIRTLVMTCKTLSSKGGDLVLVNPQPNVDKVLRTSGINTIMPIAPDMTAAMAILAK